MRFLNLAAPWAIEPSSARHYLRVYASIMARKEAGEPLDAAAPVPRGGVEDVRRFLVQEGVATINVRGPIVPHADLLSQISNTATVEGIRAQLGQAIESEDVNAIIMSFDSPGGIGTGISDLAHAIQAASKIKPIVAFCEGYCCSAANWLAAGATERVVSSTGIMGSIGTMMAWVDDRKAMEMEGFEDVEIIASQSPKKSPKHYEEEGKAQLQSMVDDHCAVFINDMAALYGVSAATVKSDFGQGDVLTGKKAVRAGLADRVGTYDQIFAELARGKMPTRKAPATIKNGGQNKGVSNMGLLEKIAAQLGISDGSDEPETAPVAAAPSPLQPIAQTGQVLVAGMTEAEVMAMKAQLDEQKAQVAAVEAQRAQDAAIQREADAVAFAAQYSGLFAENGSEATGEEGDRAKFTKAITDLHLAAQTTGTVEQLTALCSQIKDGRVVLGAAALGADALKNAVPANGNGDGKPVGLKAAESVTKDKYKDVDPSAPYHEEGS